MVQANGEMTSQKDAFGQGTEGMTYQLVYLSSASELYSRQALLDILQISRYNNSRANITGLLLYHEGNIIQFLEGEQEAVENLYNKIAKDHRHKGVLPLLRRMVRKRDFGAWSMGFRDVADHTTDVDGFSNLMNSLKANVVSDPSMSKEVQRLIGSYRNLWDTGREYNKLGVF